MLGANRLAVEAWPLFPAVWDGGKLRPRGFTGVRADDTSWTWPLWPAAAGADAVGSLLALPELQARTPDPSVLRGYGVAAAYRTRRILVGKTPNLTPPVRV